jgi:coproporphyrinogen III oxidase
MESNNRMAQVDYRSNALEFFSFLQKQICSELETLEPSMRFVEDEWERIDQSSIPGTGKREGGGGRSRILKGGKVFEQAGVNFSSVHGTMTAELVQKLVGVFKPEPFFATGVSLVIHPFSPMVPTVHANFRYLEVGEKKWFGGGSDLTPYYLFEDDARHFHSVLKTACDKVNSELYSKFKKQCDEYFYIRHRGEGRGIGGVFFDYLGKENPSYLDTAFDVCKEVGDSFLSAYLPIVRKRMNEDYGEKEKHFQLIRRGRYVEFNLVYDRGTQFGLQTAGRIESILMSLPPEVRWEYNFQILPGSREDNLIEVLKSPRNWT